MADAAPDDVIGVLFDLDGTLLDFEGSSHQALNVGMRHCVMQADPINGASRLRPDASGEIVSWQQHAAIVGTPAHSWGPGLVDLLGLADIVDWKDFVHEFHANVEEDFPSMPPMPGAVELVAQLRGRPNIRMAIATSSERHSFDKKMSYHKATLLEPMQAVVTGNEILRGKPNPDIFIEAAKRIGVPLSRCVVFEDSPSGCLAGTAAGALVVAVPDARMAEWNGNRFNETIAFKILSSLSELNWEEVEQAVRKRNTPSPELAGAAGR